MRVLLFILSILALLAGAATLAAAPTIMQQIAGILQLMLAAVLFVGAAVVERLQLNSKLLTAIEQKLSVLEVRPAAIVNSPVSTASPPPVDGPRYWVRSENETTGPFPISQLRQLRSRGAITDETPVAREGDNEWRKAADVIST